MFNIMGRGRNGASTWLRLWTPRHARRLFQVAHEAPCPSSTFEQVTPVVFLPEFLHAVALDDTPQSTTLDATAAGSRAHGYSTACITLANKENMPKGVDAFISNLHDQLKLLPMPPLLIACGTSVYFANKYLESFPFSAALFLNPRAPEVALAVHDLPAAELALLESALRDPINLEPCPIPLLVVRTGTHAQQPKSHMSWLLDVHEIDPEEVVDLSIEAGGLWEHSEVADWIDAVA